MKYFDGVDYKSVDKTLKYFKLNPMNYYHDEYYFPCLLVWGFKS